MIVQKALIRPVMTFNLLKTEMEISLLPIFCTSWEWNPKLERVSLIAGLERAKIHKTEQCYLMKQYYNYVHKNYLHVETKTIQIQHVSKVDLKCV